ncbi:MAG: hypothetical protein GX133_02585, partial [Syntrophomonadaceae bacterium]|nr:hypothetical protein [Syntrophomonadaceae bacterium]
DSLYILYELANVYFVLDKTVYAERLYKHVMQGAQRIQGNEPLVFRCVIGLAGLYLRTEQYSIAEPFCRLIFEIYKRFHDVTSAEFRLAALNMAFASQMVGNLIEADAYCRLFCADEEELGEAKSKLACANKFEDLSKLQKEIRKIN